MVRIVVAALIALAISIAAGPTFIEFLRTNTFGQPIREEGPQGHMVKQGTPTMGGLLFLVAALIPFLALGSYTTNALIVLFIAMACAAIGFVDDWAKLTKRRSLGLSGRWKLLALALITVIVSIVLEHRHFSTSVYIPIADIQVPLSYGWYPFLFLVIAGASNGVNLTDGLDGLAGGTATIAFFTFIAMIVIAYIRSGPPLHRSSIYLDLGILCAALIGGIVGFIWFNAFPAEVFMGDTGSMAIGGALAGFAIVMKTEVLLLFIGGIYLIEALSVMIQVFTFRRTGRRVFLMAPVHHHFEMKGWHETKIMVRFWIVTAILCAGGFALYYRYYFKFFRG